MLLDSSFEYFLLTATSGTWIIGVRPSSTNSSMIFVDDVASSLHFFYELKHLIAVTASMFVLNQANLLTFKMFSKKEM